MTTPLKPPSGPGGTAGTSSTISSAAASSTERSTPTGGAPGAERVFRDELVTTPDVPSARPPLASTRLAAVAPAAAPAPSAQSTQSTQSAQSAQSATTGASDVSSISLPESMAQAIRAGRLAPTDAIDALVQHTMGSPLASALAPEAKRRLEASLRAQLVEDPALASLVADLGRAPSR